MPTISFDGQSLLLDGRRLWLVSGAIHYSRTPRELWADRIRAAKQAGINCIETYVFWNLHEPAPGKFNFRGDADLRHFVKLVGEAGMYCILRPGPYVCAEWDFGGLPAWLHRVTGVKLRQHNGPFLEACSRYLRAVMEQVRDLQYTEPPSSNAPPGGPIILMQAENEWFCANPPVDNNRPGDRYLAEIVRYLRENGCTTPIVSCNNLWQKVEGVIDTWNACEHLPADLRQLRVVRPDQPRIVTEYWTGWFDRWGGEHRDNQSTELLEYRLAGILAQGAQYNLYMFHGGTNFAFYGGRSVATPDCFMTTSYDYDAPLSEAGGRGPKYRAAQRVSMFASQFGSVLGNLDPADHHVAVQPTEQDHDLSVIHQRGSQGDVVFLLRPPQRKTEPKTHNPVKLLLSNGLSLPVYMGEDAAAWVLLGAKLNSCELNYTNLRPWAWVNKRMLVLFGPAGTQGLLAINNAPLTVTVPTEKQDKPLVVEHEDVVVVVLNRRQVDMAYVNGKDQLVIGAWALDAADEPLRDPGASAVMVVDQEAKVRKLDTSNPPRRTAPKLGPWRSMPAAELTPDGQARFKSIDGPASLETLGCDFGYGWYRLQWPTAPKMPAGTKLLIPNSGDRLHLYAGNKALGVLGLGPGAVRGPVSNKLPAKAQELTILADNLGRYNFGWRMGESKGVPEHLYAVKPIPMGKPKVTREAAPNPFVLSDFWVNLRAGATGQRPWYTFTFRAKGSEPVVLEATDFPLKAMVFVNDQPLNLIDTSPWGSYTQFVLRPGQELKPGGGVQTLRIALLNPTDTPPNVAKHLKLYQAVANLSGKAEWSFTPWSPLEDGKADEAKPASGLPCWHRTSFKVSHNDTPLWLDPAGLSKGQIYLNGHNVGRYFVATADGKKVTPQSLYYLPEPWLRTDGPNELLIFDEHGKSPAPGKGCRLVYDWMAPYNRAT